MNEVIFLVNGTSVCLTLFESSACISKAYFSHLMTCFLLLVERVVFEKVENLVIHTSKHFKQFSFLTHWQHFFPHFFCVLLSLQFEKLKHCPILLMLD